MNWALNLLSKLIDLFRKPAAAEQQQLATVGDISEAWQNLLHAARDVARESREREEETQQQLQECQRTTDRQTREINRLKNRLDKKGPSGRE